ncbi:outer membrane protein transport protein [Guyparkeria sp. GHLCS8-2]|uniref:OmpP1/FadL family transporter n=1 Tax=Guyparkeria halopsychrophila TaxID=3139421 RepID=UPI0037C7CEB8
MTFKRTLLAAAITGATFAAGSAHATNGYFSHGYGVKSMGMGGGGVAFANDNVMAIATNPAALADVSDQVHFDVSWFKPVRGYEYTNYMNGTPTGSGEGDSDKEAFYIPSLGMSYRLTDNDSIGIAVYGNGGMNTDYPAISGNYLGFPGVPADGPYGDGSAGVNLEQLFITPTYSRQFMDDKLTVGVSAVIARQKFKAKGLGNFNGTGGVAQATSLPPFTVDPQNMTGNGHDKVWGYGGKVGVTFKPTDMITLAASYQSEIDTEEFDKYSGLFAEGGDFDIPATWTVGMAADVHEDVTVTFDYQRINYGDIKAISNPSTEYLNMCLGGWMSTGAAGANCLGGSDGAGFGWDDINVYKLGVQWQATPKLQVRAGWNRGDNPISSEDALFNTIAPGVVENHYTAGFSYTFNKNHEMHGAFMYAPEVSVNGSNQFLSDLAAQNGMPGVTQDLTIRMKQYEATVGYTYKF